MLSWPDPGAEFRKQIVIVQNQPEEPASETKPVGGRKATVRYRNRTTEIKLKPGGTVQLTSELQKVSAIRE